MVRERELYTGREVTNKRGEETGPRIMSMIEGVLYREGVY